jgi:glycosyltransferase involved in cell wall biosynthesis
VTVGFHAPLPPAASGVADYAAALLTALRARGPVEIAPARCDVALYHLGNNPLHAAIYRRALEQPGVVVLHDAVLHHFLLGTLDEAAYVEEFVYNYGEWARGLATELWRGRAGSGFDSRYFSYPMLRRVAERSRAVVVHNPAAAAMVRAHAPDARVVEIPHLCEPPPPVSAADATAFRRRHRVPAGAFLFGVFGYLRESKRLAGVLEAFAKLHAENPATALLVAGDFVSRDLERAAAPLLLAPGVHRLPYLAEAAFWRAAAAVDACVNLRDPGAGETSGITIRLMGMAKPVLLSEGPETAAFPEDACLRVPRGAAERQALFEHMVLLVSMSEVAREIGLRGAAFVSREHAVERSATLYWSILCESVA